MGRETVSQVTVNHDTHQLHLVYDTSSDDGGFRDYVYDANNQDDLLKQLQLWRKGADNGSVVFLNDTLGHIEQAINDIKQPTLF